MINGKDLVRYFSEYDSDDEDKLIDQDKSNIKKGLIAAGILGGGKIATGVLEDKLMKSGFKGETESASKDVYGKLQRHIKDLGVKLKQGNAPCYRKEENTIYMTKNHTPSMVAHELGHVEIDKGKVGKFLKILQSNPDLLYNQDTRLAKIGHTGLGFAAGYNNEKRKSEGKKESKLLKYGSRLAPLALGAAGLGVEAAASIRGHKLLKNSDASKDLLKSSKKTLLSAWLNHSQPVINNTILNEVGYQLGKLAHKLKKRKENKDEEEERR